MATVHVVVRDEAGHQATQDVTVSLSGTPGALGRIAGVHVLQQVASTGELASLRTSILSALAVPGVVAFGVRAPWNTVDASFAIFDAALDIAGTAGKALTVRFMAGSHTPDRIRNVAPMLGTGSSRYPRPFDSSGVLNAPFLSEYGEYVELVAGWCRANDVPQLHLSHYAKDWAEFYWGPEVQAIMGSGAAGQTAMVNATNALADAGLAVAGSDLMVELPMSGHGPLMRSSPTASPGIAERVAQHIAAEGVDRMLIQGNGWDEDGIWGATASTEVNFDFVLNAGCLLGVQMIQPYNTYTWSEVFDTATVKGATTAEVYLPSFSGGTSAQLRAECGAWVPNAA